MGEVMYPIDDESITDNTGCIGNDVLLINNQS
jgi:hypothetical protein